MLPSDMRSSQFDTRSMADRGLRSMQNDQQSNAGGRVQNNSVGPKNNRSGLDTFQAKKEWAKNKNTLAENPDEYGHLSKFL